MTEEAGEIYNHEDIPPIPSENFSAVLYTGTRVSTIYYRGRVSARYGMD